MKNSQRKTTKAKETKEPPIDISVESPENIIQMLHEDHIKVQELFFQYSQTEDEEEKEQLIKNILKELYVHSAIEEELVYPLVKDEAEDAEDLIDESQVEHHVVKLLMAELADMEPGDELYNAKVCVLAELVKHHIREEEKEMFRKMSEADIDLESIAEKVMKRKEALVAAPLPKGKALVNGRVKK